MASPLSSPLVVDAVGIRVGIDLSGLTAADRDAVARAWDDARIDGAADVVVSPASSVRPGQALSDLSSAVTQAAIRARRGALWMLHAAGLAAADGGVVVLAGPSGAGKTTATRVLGRAWAYVSDETVGIEADGRVHAYRKPLSVITAGRGYKVQHAPGELGLLPLPAAPLRVRRIVLLDRAEAHAQARLVAVPASEALVLLAPHSSALASMSDPLRTVATVLSRAGGLLRAEYAEAEDLAALLDDLMQSDLAVATERVESLPDAPPPTRPPAPAGVVRYRRATVIDACPLPDDRLAVLTAEPDGRGLLRVLGGAAPLLWYAADGATRDELLRAVVDDEPDEEALRSVDDVVAQLVEAGLLIAAD